MLVDVSGYTMLLSYMKAHLIYIIVWFWIMASMDRVAHLASNGC
jgi:hypothetical protein